MYKAKFDEKGGAFTVRGKIRSMLNHGRSELTDRLNHTDFKVDSNGYLVFPANAYDVFMKAVEKMNPKRVEVEYVRNN